MRLFLGIEIPEPLLAEIGRVQSLLRASGADVRWVEPGNVHVTMKFLGQVAADRVAAIDAALAPVAAAHAAHELQLIGVGAFPDEARPRVIWVGVEGAIVELAALHVELDASLEGLGFERENKRFSPHVTLGRVRRPRGLKSLSAAMRAHRHTPVGSFRVSTLVLFESTLTPQGARYRERSRYPLAT